MAERAQEVRKWLVEQYQDEERLAHQLDEHADAMRYEFLKAWLHRLAEHDRQHAQMLHAQIVKYGGEPLSSNNLPTKNPARLSSKVRSDVQDKRQLSFRYLQGITRIQDEELRAVLEQIEQEEEHDLKELLDIETRVM